MDSDGCLEILFAKRSQDTTSHSIIKTSPMTRTCHVLAPGAWKDAEMVENQIHFPPLVDSYTVLGALDDQVVRSLR